MGFLADLFRRPAKAAAKTQHSKPYTTVTEYSPMFSTSSGELYEQALTRAAVEKFATLCGKLKPEVLGTAKPRIARAIKTTPNEFMSWPQLIGRVATMLYVDTTAAVVPSFDDNMNVNGVFPLKFETAEVVEHAGEAWVRFYLASGEVMAIELRNCCILTRFQYQSDVFGSGNGALVSTLRLMDYQDQAQEQAIKNGAKIQFIAASASTMRPEDIERKRERFSEDNLSAKNTSGLMIYDNTFTDLKQVEPMSYTCSADEMGRIEESVFSYFGINRNILQSDYTEEQFGAYYESQVEPFAVQLGEGLTRMLYTQRERMAGNKIMFSANRLEYASNASKRNMIRDMLDRRVMTINESREILQLPPVPGGDVFIERGEYVVFDKDGNVQVQSGGRTEMVARPQGNSLGESDFDLGGDDDIYNDNDTKGKKEADE